VPGSCFFDARHHRAALDDLGSRRVSELWSDDFEVLHWVIERFERSGHSVEVGEALRVFPEEQYDSVRNSLVRLSNHSYMVTVNGGGLGRSVPAGSPVVSDVADRTLRLVSALPDNAELLADRILAVLAEGVVNEDDPETRYRLEAGLRGLGGMTRDVFVEVLAAAVARSAGPTARARPRHSQYHPVASDYSEQRRTAAN
ncbi:MAG: hypothetical protein M3300_03720, partial [Actinomycetota bacterium]|nr:hypothetical protein [Actinomycetota bacterium]